MHAVLLQLGLAAEERDSFTRLLEHSSEGHLEGVHVTIIVIIDGREAIPVRAIPLTTHWENLSPDQLVDIFAFNDRYYKFKDFTAYRLASGKPAPIPPLWWESWAVLPLKALSQRLSALEDAGELAESDGYLAWRDQSLPLMPQGAFVWKDEFEQRYLSRFGSENESVLMGDYEDDGETPRVMEADVLDARVALDFDPFIPSEDTRRLVMQGFEELPPPMGETPPQNTGDIPGAEEGTAHEAVMSESPAATTTVTATAGTPAAHGLAPAQMDDISIMSGDPGAAARTLKNLTRPIRSDELTLIIKEAQKQCENPEDTTEVWVRLQTMAGKLEMNLKGSDEGGVKYEMLGEPAWITKNQLRDRLRNQRLAREREKPL